MPFSTSTSSTDARATMAKVGHLAEDAAASVQDMTNRSIERAREMSTNCASAPTRRAIRPWATCASSR
jgi:hypothetical protein